MRGNMNVKKKWKCPEIWTNWFFVPYYDISSYFSSAEEDIMYIHVCVCVCVRARTYVSDDHTASIFRVVQAQQLWRWGSKLLLNVEKPANMKVIALQKTAVFIH